MWFLVGWLGMVIFSVYADCDPITAGQADWSILIGREPANKRAGFSKISISQLECPSL